MPDPDSKHSENLPGPWYVDSNCISCGLCGEYAPATFRPSSDNSQHVVYHQPVSGEDLLAAEQVKVDCPVDAIGNDG